MLLMLMGGGDVQDQNADVIIGQMLTKFMHHSETFFDNLSLVFGEVSYQNLLFFHVALKINKHKYEGCLAQFP